MRHAGWKGGEGGGQLPSPPWERSLPTVVCILLALLLVAACPAPCSARRLTQDVTNSAVWRFNLSDVGKPPPYTAVTRFGAPLPSATLHVAPGCISAMAPTPAAFNSPAALYVQSSAPQSVGAPVPCPPTIELRFSVAAGRRISSVFWARSYDFALPGTWWQAISLSNDSGTTWHGVSSVGAATPEVTTTRQSGTGWDEMLQQTVPWLARNPNCYTPPGQPVVPASCRLRYTNFGPGGDVGNFQRDNNPLLKWPPPCCKLLRMAWWRTSVNTVLA